MQSIRRSVLLASIVLAVVQTGAQAQQPPETTHDGLSIVRDSDADLAYVLPEADFSIYDSFIILEPMVAFKKNWQRDFNRQSRTASGRISEGDMERIKDGMAALFLEVFTEELESGGYPVVDEPGETVLIIRPAIIDLDIAAPDIPTAGRVDSYVTRAGSAGLYVEFFDSVTEQILARVVDYKAARDRGTFQWATSASNRAEARLVLRSWANMLVDRLDEIREE